MRGLRRFLGDHRGAAAVEFAIVAIPLLLFMFGTIEFARLMWTRQSMQSLAISAARCMGLLQTTCATTAGTAVDTAKTNTYITSRASGFGVAITAGNITLNSSTTCNGVSGFSTVTIDYTFSTLAPKLLMALAGGSALSTTACFPNQV